MKVERISNSKTFSDVDVGEVFTEDGGTCVFLRIDVDSEYTRSFNHDGLAVNLDTGEVTWFDNSNKVWIFPNAKVIF